jgi:segregation and condensation protein A
VGYVVTTPAFSGPMELLFKMVSTHEMDVLDIPLAPVVDAFVAELAARGAEMPLDEVSEFLLFAAILLELKSKGLLPGPEEIEPDEELAEWETRDVLISRLLECRAYAAAAEIFSTLAERAARSVPREVGLDDGFEVTAPDLLAGLKPGQLAEAFLRVSEERPAPRVDLSHVTVDLVSVAEAVDELVLRLPAVGRTSFRALIGHLRTRIEVIVRFLAVLELCKLGKVELGQGRTFGDLEVSWIHHPEELVAAGVGALAVDDYDG